MTEDKYKDIIGLEHHTSAIHPRMSMLSRAAQFAPFAALTGYEAVITETARLTNRKVELSADEKSALDEKIRSISDHIHLHPKINVTYFVSDKKKAGGEYFSCSGELKEIDDVYRRLVFMDKFYVFIDDVVSIEDVSGIDEVEG
ncbi:MAG: hypothetical protein K5984_05190 [Bacteroidales bacterium]|nr:hypothetical protein [Bacteroidales bacterium]